MGNLHEWIPNSHKDIRDRLGCCEEIREELRENYLSIPLREIKIIIRLEHVFHFFQAGLFFSFPVAPPIFESALGLKTKHRHKDYRYSNITHNDSDIQIPISIEIWHKLVLACCIANGIQNQSHRFPTKNICKAQNWNQNIIDYGNL
jgi:hypothetical protein